MAIMVIAVAVALAVAVSLGFIIQVELVAIEFDRVVPAATGV